MCKPIEIGTCENGIYTMYTWVDGKDVEDVIPRHSEAEQYGFGLTAGEIIIYFDLMRITLNFYVKTFMRWKDGNCCSGDNFGACKWMFRNFRSVDYIYTIYKYTA